MTVLVYMEAASGRIARYDGKRRTHAGYYSPEDFERIDWKDAAEKLRYWPPAALKED